MESKAAGMLPASARGRVVGFDVSKGFLEIGCKFDHVAVGARVVVSIDETPLTLVERLQPLCRRNHGSDWTRAPWALEMDGRRYVGATSGVAIVAIESIEPAPAAVAELPGMVLGWRYPNPTPIDLDDLMAWLGAERTRETCSVCSGTCKVKCGRCSGTGEIAHGCGCDRCAVDPRPCPGCSGSKTLACKNCDAQGTVAIDKTADRRTIVGLAGKAFDRDVLIRYFALLEGQTQLRIEPGLHAPVTIEASNGFAIVMPMSCPAPITDSFPSAPAASPAPSPLTGAGAEEVVRAAALTDCTKCDGGGKIADTEKGEPWTAWSNLPPGSDLAVRAGLVKPLPCPVCKGFGKVGAL